MLATDSFGSFMCCSSILFVFFLFILSFEDLLSGLTLIGCPSDQQVGHTGQQQWLDKRRLHLRQAAIAHHHRTESYLRSTGSPMMEHIKTPGGSNTEPCCPEIYQRYKLSPTSYRMKRRKRKSQDGESKHTRPRIFLAARGC